MVNLDTGMAQCTAYGHYKFYHSYEHKNGGVTLFSHTVTDSTLYDKLNGESVSMNYYNKVCRKVAKEGTKRVFNTKEDYRFYMKHYLHQAFR